jgi:putative ABC transport system permease protein
VTEQTREIGIRVAVGATRSDVVRMVLWGAGRLAGLGLGLGVVIAAGLSRFLAGQLHGVEAVDPATYGVLMAALATVVLVAGFVPAMRATRVDPVEALKAE